MQQDAASSKKMYNNGMNVSSLTMLCVVLMATVIIGVDVLFFKNFFWERLVVNTGIALIFIACYLRFLK